MRECQGTHPPQLFKRQEPSFPIPYGELYYGGGAG